MKWFWSQECSNAIEILKLKLSKAPVLVHYDANIKMGLACDASSSGLGAVLFHIYADGTEKPICYASKTLNKSEVGYSQIEKEALGIIFGVKKFHQYLLGRKFALYTDHKPLLSLFSPTKGLPKSSCNRLLRWSIILSGYDYEITYKRSIHHANADSFSRLPIANENSDFDKEAYFVNKLLGKGFEKLPINLREIQKASNEDNCLSKILDICVSKKGWPKPCPDQWMEFKKRKTELWVMNGCLMWGDRVVIPKIYRKYVLKTLHRSHPGIVKMKSLARGLVWWPGIDLDIEHTVKSCWECSINADEKTKIFKSWQPSEQPWDRVHMDFAGPFMDHMWLIVVDTHTKWLEVIRMKRATAYNTKLALLSVISRLGIMKTLVSDNGKHFKNLEIKQFCDEFGINHIFSPPFHPSSNGMAEINVKIFKRALKANHLNLEESLQEFLRNYRNTPHTATGRTPFEMMFGRKARTLLSQCNPVLENVSGVNSIKTDCFSPDDLIWARDYASTAKWRPGRILMREGSMVYEVQLGDGKTTRRHFNQLRKRTPPRPEAEGSASRVGENDNYLYFKQDVSTSSPREDSPVPVPTATVVDEPRYPTRLRRPPLTFAQEFNYV